LGLRHRSRLRLGTAVAPGGGRSLYSCIYPSNWPFGGELKVRSVCLVGSSEDRLRLRLRPSSVPGRAPPSSGGAFTLRPAVLSAHRLGGALFSFIHNNRRGSSSPPSGRRGRSQKSVKEPSQLLCLGMGWAQSDIAPTPQQLRLRPCGGYASVGAWHGGDGDKENSRNFRRRRSS
jgi:hypothetical protein